LGDDDHLSPVFQSLGIGAFTALITGSLPTAIVAALTDTVGAISASVVLDVRQALLSREQVRLEKSIIEMVAANARLISAGRTLRDDWNVSQCASAEEIFDATLRAAMQASESKKLKHVSCLPMQVAYDPEISAEMAHRLIELARNCSYLELKVLYAMTLSESFVLRGVSVGAQIRDPIFDAVISLMFKGLINPSGLGSKYGGPFFNRLWVSASGLLLVKTMELHTIDRGEIQTVIDRLDELSTESHPPGS
jgi:hypothetical protein